MEQWRKDARREAVITDIDALVPKDHLVRKIEKVMDYEWLYERLAPYYCHDNGRPGIDPVVLIDGADTTSVRDSVVAADVPGDTDKFGIPMVFGIWALG